MTKKYNTQEIIQWFLVGVITALGSVVVMWMSAQQEIDTSIFGITLSQLHTLGLVFSVAVFVMGTEDRKYQYMSWGFMLVTLLALIKFILHDATQHRIENPIEKLFTY